MSEEKFGKIMDDNVVIDKKTEDLDNIISKDGTLKYDFMISLTHITAAKIVTNLWMSENIQQQIVDLYRSTTKPKLYFFGYNRLKEIENAVVNKISELSLPESVSEMLINIVHPIGMSIHEWIRYHGEYVFSGYYAVDFIDHIKWTTRGKIAYDETARQILIKQDCLTDDYRYKLACTYCLEDDILFNAPKVLTPFYLNDVQIDKQPMVYFWTSHITGDIAKLHDALYNIQDTQQNSSANELIIRLLVQHFKAINEVAVKFIWNKLSEEEKITNIPSLLGGLSGQDFSFSVLSSLSYEQQQNIFKKDAGKILLSILRNSLMEKFFFPTALHVLDYVDPKWYTNVLESLAEKMKESAREKKVYEYTQYKVMLKQLCQVGSKHIKDLVSEPGDIKHLARVLAFSLSWERDMDIINMILGYLTVRQKKSIILDYYGIRKCTEFIYQDRWDLLDLFIEHTLLPKEDLTWLKQDVVEDEGEGIVMHYVTQEKWDKLEYFMKWAFKSEEEVKQFKKNLLYSHVCEMYLNEEEMNSVVKWCTASP